VHVAEQKRTIQPTILVVIGIGGSHLGTQAVQEAVYGRFYNELQHPMRVYYADTVDTSYIRDIYNIVEAELARGGNIILNVVTKSGSTTETLANAAVFIALLKEYKPDRYQDYIVVTTDAGSPADTYAQDIGATMLPIPARVGGRYSVFTAVGLFPLALMGIDIDRLCRGAAEATVQCLKVDESNVALTSAAILFWQYQHGKHIHDTFVFDVACEWVGKWYRQLMAESLGKAEDRQGNAVHIGMTPTVSVGTADLHSVAQLYLGGPYDKMTTFVTTSRKNHDLLIPEHPLSNRVQADNTTIARVHDAIFQGVQAAYAADDRPYVTYELAAHDSASIGQFMQLKMFETVYLGALFNVNPFNQPNVESYKKETRRLLQNEQS
jgi:glucose-6-phosphate isomerase